jgi:hypothetical protein
MVTGDEGYWYEELEEKVLKVIRQTELPSKIDKILEETVKDIKFEILTRDRQEEIVIITGDILKDMFAEVIRYTIVKQLRGVETGLFIATRKDFRLLGKDLKAGKG